MADEDAERQEQPRNVIRWTIIIGVLLGALTFGCFIIVIIFTKFRTSDELPEPKFENMPAEEYNRMLNPIKIGICNANTNVSDVDFTSKRPDKFDWRETGFVDEVMDQGNCSACWAFNIFSDLQIKFSIMMKKFTKLSFAHLQRTFPDMCNASSPFKRMKQMINNNITILTDFCDKEMIDGRKQCTDSVGITNYHHMTCRSSEEIMQTIYTKGPVMALVNAKMLQNYSGRVVLNDLNVCRACDNPKHSICEQGCTYCRNASLTDGLCNDYSCSNSSLNHVVLIVAYNTRAAIPHYIVQTSWGKDYGDQGYIRIAIGNNICGIETSTTYLEIKKHP